MKTIRVGINGMGRIGRAFVRIASDNPLIEIVAINTAKSDPPILSYLIEYDSIYGKFQKDITANSSIITIDKKNISCFNYRDPKDIPWDTLGVDIVVDCTGVFKTRLELAKHLGGSVKKVILTAPTKDKSIPHVVLGVNDGEFDFANSSIISNTSCTTNCASHMFKIINDELVIKSGFLTTIHSYTSSQQLVDNAGKTPTLSRAAPTSIIPSTTGATDAVVKTIPTLSGKINAMSVRVPVPIVSYADISCVVEKPTTVADINKLFSLASSRMPDFISYQSNQLVSSDFIGSSASCIFDANYTQVLPENLIKIFGWYDNEWGYTSRLVDLVQRVSAFI